MTNNPTIDGVSRALIENAANYMEGSASAQVNIWCRDLRALLDAPAFERQEPAKWSYCPECGSEEINHEEGAHKQCAECHQEWFSDLNYTDVVRKHLGGKFTDPQSTIDRLEARVAELESGFFQEVLDEDLKKISDFVGDGDLPKRSFFLRPDAADLANMTMHMVRNVQSLRIKLAELERGRGEPVAYTDMKELNRLNAVKSGYMSIIVYRDPGALVSPLYAAPPAPVAVALPAIERELGSPPLDHLRGLLELVVNPGTYPVKVLHDQIRATLDTMACLDATAALNEVKP